MKKEIPKITTSTERDSPRNKLIQEIKDDYNAGKITKAKRDASIKEILEYKDLD